MKIVFLDIDGVLNNGASISDGIHMLPEKVLLVRQLCERCDAKIVISSSWRIGTPKRELFEILRVVGMPSDLLLDYTPVLNGKKRGEEITAWMAENAKAGNEQLSNYVILDDDTDFLPHQKDHHVKTDFAIGFSWYHLKKALKVLEAA